MKKYSVGTNDFINGLKTALFTSIFTILVTLTQNQDFNVFTTDWGMVISNVINVSFITIVGYMSRKFFENEEGKMLG